MKPLPFALATIALSSSIAWADAPAPSPARPTAGRAPVSERLRGVDGGLARDAGPSIAPGAAGRVGEDKRDEATLSRQRVGGGAAPSAKAAPAPTAVASPYAAAIARAEAAVVKAKPRASGRVKLTLQVDRTGRVVDAFVVSWDRKLDRTLEQQLAREVMPDVAGRTIETALMFRGGVVVRR